MNNLTSGQALQNRYSAQPFSDSQNQAYQNQANQSSYMRGLIPSLLGQMSSQQVGFDRSNPNARPTAYNFDGVGSNGGSGGLLGSLQSAPAQPLNLNASAPAPAPEAPKSSFVNLDVTNPMNAYYGQLLSPNGIGVAGTNSAGTDAWLQAFQQSAGGAGYGTFKYGQAMPMPGTQQYRDMQEYLAYGGADPYNLYGGRA
ncbi:hypothetical protein WKW77_20025 [Variovorax ureilyticus]|uniref:Uncharacterized protein n=1 Tax=Variovorax ureilyticus TaxID=1836198 RepID=A0ABU8VIT4_9BURK